MKGSEYWRELESLFPQLGSCAVKYTSDPTSEYNCIAWAAGDTADWWWPFGERSYWPVESSGVASVAEFVIGFSAIGYEPCADGDLQDGYEKVAIYAVGDVVKHMARQLPSGAWTSKLGDEVDIEHERIEGLEGDLYGSVVQFMRRVVSEVQSAEG